MDPALVPRPGPELLKALEHPMRFHILGMLLEREASPNELAKELGEKVSTVAYHVRRLRDLDAVELVRTGQRRGATQHFYRAKVRPWLTTEEVAELPRTVVRSLSGGTLSRIVTKAMSALADGSFDRADAQLAFVPMELDPRGHGEAIRLIEELVERLVDLHEQSQARAIARQAGTPDPRRRLEGAVLMYDSARAVVVPPPAGDETT